MLSLPLFQKQEEARFLLTFLLIFSPFWPRAASFDVKISKSNFWNVKLTAGSLFRPTFDFPRGIAFVCLFACLLLFLFSCVWFEFLRISVFVCLFASLCFLFCVGCILKAVCLCFCFLCEGRSVVLSRPFLFVCLFACLCFLSVWMSFFPGFLLVFVCLLVCVFVSCVGVVLSGLFICLFVCVFVLCVEVVLSRRFVFVCLPLNFLLKEKKKCCRSYFYLALYMNFCNGLLRNFADMCFFTFFPLLKLLPCM